MTLPTTVALDVVLLPPEEVMERCREVNAFLWNTSPQGYLFDETHLPHISLLQQYTLSESLDDVYDILRRTAVVTKPFVLTATGVSHESLSDGTPYNGFEIAGPPALHDLKRLIIAELAQFSTDGDARAFVTDPGETIRPLSARWVATFRNHAHGADFHFHISLGVGPAPAFPGPFTFTTSRLAVCQLGDLNTCRSILAEWQLI